MSEHPTGLAGLARQQRALLALVKGRPVAGEADRYLDLVRASPGLPMLRLITTWWRRYDVARLAPLTSGVLTATGRFADALDRLGRDPDTPTAFSALALHFLEQYVADADPLVAAVASTERALALIGRGDRSEHEIGWDRDPAPVLNALLAGRPPGPAERGEFVVRLGFDADELTLISSPAGNRMRSYQQPLTLLISTVIRQSHA